MTQETTVLPPYGTPGGTPHWLDVNGATTWALWDGVGWRLGYGGARDLKGRVYVGGRLRAESIAALGWKYKAPAVVAPDTVPVVIEWSAGDAR